MKTKIFALCIMLFTQVVELKAQLFKNLDFQQTCDSSKTGFCNWDLSWGTKGSARPDRQDRFNTLLIQGIKENPVGFVEQTAIIAPVKDLRILTVSALIRSDSVQGKGAGLNIGMYDSAGNLLSNKDMGGFYSIDWIRGTNPWKEYSISIVFPEQTAKIKIGMILYGKGKVWFKNFRTNLTQVTNRKHSKFAEDYILAAADTIMKHSLVRDSIDIRKLRKIALQIAGPATTYRDCFLAINYLLESLRPFGDHHSFFMTAAEVKNWKIEGSQVSKIEYPTYKQVDNCGYISVPAFHGGNPLFMHAFADSLQQAIQKLSLQGIKGWVIDLRKNTGGNMTPMIAGLGPLFSSKKLGSLVDVNGKYNSWYYHDGKYFWDEEPGLSVSNPVKLNSKLPIAILTSDQTGSSGEAVVVSFIGNANTRSFGLPTWGLTTGNGSFALADGSEIFLASTVMADRNGRMYRSRIEPDETVASRLTPGKTDQAIKAATDWIRNFK